MSTDKPRSLARATGDRFFEMSKQCGCAADAFFHRLNTLDGTQIDEEHQYLIDGIRAAVAELGKHAEYAEQVIAHITSEKRRAAVLAKSPCVDLNGKPLGPVTVDPRTVEAA